MKQWMISAALALTGAAALAQGSLLGGGSTSGCGVTMSCPPSSGGGGSGGGGGQCTASPGGSTCGTDAGPASTGSGGGNTGANNPINVTNGNKYQREVDMAALPGVLGLELVRHYNSVYSTATTPTGNLGRGWKLSYETQLHVVGNTVQIVQADGTRHMFDKDAHNPSLCAGRSASSGKVHIVQDEAGTHYQWTWRDGRTLRFDARGLLEQIRQPSGEFVTLQYERNGRLLKVTDPQGRSLKMNYLSLKEAAKADRFRGIQSIDTPVGRYGFAYGSALPAGSPHDVAVVLANLVKVTMPNGKVARVYHHEDARFPTLLTGVSITARGEGGKQAQAQAQAQAQTPKQVQRLATYAYDARGWAVASDHGSKVELMELERPSLNEKGRMGRVVLVHSKSSANPQGLGLEVKSAQVAGQYRILETRGQACPVQVNCPEANVRYSYDRRGQLTLVTHLDDKGQPVQSERHQYDALQRLVQVGRIGYIAGKAQPEQMVVRYGFEGSPDGEQPTLVARPSVVAGKEHQIKVAYNAYRQPVRVTETGWAPVVGVAGAQPQAATQISRTTSYGYARINGRSALQAVDGPLAGTADTARFEWDARAAYMVRKVQGQDLAHSYDKRDQAGRIVQETPPDGIAIEYSYLPTGQEASWRRGQAVVQVSHDDFGRPVRIALPDGEVRRIGYGEGGKADQAVAVVSNTGQAQWLDPAMSLAKRQSANPNMGLQRASLARAWTDQRVAVDDFGRLIGIHSQETGWERRHYDEANRLIRRELADGTVWRWQRDALGRITAHEVSRPGAETLRSQLKYAGVRLMGIEYPKESEHYAYDDLGRVKAKTILRASLRYTEAYEYDAADRVTKVHLPEGGSLRYSWGVGRQLKAIAHDDGRASAVLGQALSGWLGWGQQVVIEPLRGAGGQQAAAMAPASAASSGAVGAVPASLQAQARVEQGYRWGNGVELRWHLGEQGQLAGIRYVGADIQAPWHERLLAWLPSAQAADHNGASPGMLGAPKALIELGYQYDAWGRMSEREQDGIRTGYAYDALGRLLVTQQATAGAAAPQVEYYAYDDQGQMRASHVMARQHDWRQVRTQRDASGLPMAIEGGGVPARALRYSADRRLIEVRQGGQVLASYSHNTHGQRIGKVLADGRSTQYLWSQGQLVGETLPQAKGGPAGDAANEPSFSLARRYVYAHGVPVAVIDHVQGGATLKGQQDGGPTWLGALWRWVSESAPTITSVHANEIGTPIAATDAGGKLVWRAEYSAYGVIKTVSRTGQPGKPEAGFELNLRLPGQYFDAETGWHDNGLRTYDPQRGAYLEPDPLGPVPNWASGRLLTQPYAYANHNPLIYADPTGLILFAFDGTNNSNPPPGVDDFSNVYKFFLAYIDGQKWYMNGVGRNDPDSQINTNGMDQYNANTARARVDYMLGQLDQYMKDTKFQAGEEVNIDIVGFSRGAAMSRDFANRVAQRLRDQTYKSSGACVQIRFLGVWDTVAQFGANGAANSAWQLAIPAEVKHVFHAVAVNEHRYLFPGESIGRGVQRGFIGSHADIGGSYGTGDLSDVALNWIVEEAKKDGVGVKMRSWEDIGHTEWAKVTNPVVHNKNTDGGDRDFCLRVNNEAWADNCQKQSVANVGGMDTSQARAFIIERTKAVMDADGSSPITGDVDMEAYTKWLKENYGLQIEY